MDILKFLITVLLKELTWVQTQFPDIMQLWAFSHVYNQYIKYSLCGFLELFCQQLLRFIYPFSKNPLRMIQREAGNFIKFPHSLHLFYCILKKERDFFTPVCFISLSQPCNLLPASDKFWLAVGNTVLISLNFPSFRGKADAALFCAQFLGCLNSSLFLQTGWIWFQDSLPLEGKSLSANC